MREHLLVIERLMAVAIVVLTVCWAIAILGSEYIGMYNMSFHGPVLSLDFLAATLNVLFASLIAGFAVMTWVYWFADLDNYARTGFWIAIITLLLPVINLQASNLLWSMGIREMSDFLYAYRGMVLPVGFVGLIMVEIIFVKAESPPNI